MHLTPKYTAISKLNSTSAMVEPAASSPDTPTIRVRTYAPSDYDAVCELFTAGMLLYSPTPGEVHPDFAHYIEDSINGDLAHIETTYVASGGQFWVATCEQDDGTEVVVGMVGLEGKPNQAFELRRMSVHAEYRRFGVGRLLVSELERFARAHSVQKVWLTTGAPMLPAHKFYASMGYINTKREMVAEGFEILFFEKALE